MDSDKTTTKIPTPFGPQIFKKKSLKVSSLRPSRSLRKARITPQTPIEGFIKKNLFDKSIETRN